MIQQRPFRLNWGVFGGNANKSGDRGGPRNDRNDRSLDSSRGPDRDRDRSRNESTGLNRRNPTSDNTYQVHVGDLDVSISKQQLMDHFKKKYHSVVDAKIPQDNATRISRGYGFVHFTNYEESQKAIGEMNGTLLKGKPIKVNHASSKNTTTNGSSGGGNHSRGNSHSNNNHSVLGQIYGTGYVGSPTNGQRGGPILGGLGVQFKPTDHLGQPMMAIPPQQYTYINPATGQPMQVSIFT